ncbi:MAG: sensor domain-containing diguanylate cyclase [Alicyclobacillus sp.]|nr:sensor domain-containing diguanylate cyclase [Alicyclobacillus sp.]
MNHLFFRERLQEASSEILQMLRSFIDINTLFVAINDRQTNYILSVTNKEEALVTEGEMPFFESYCSLVCRDTRTRLLTISNTEIDPQTASMDITKRLGATTFIGVPIVKDDGTPLGTVCAMDRKPYDIEDREVQLLQMASKFLAHVIELENLAYRDTLTGAFTRNYLDVAWRNATETYATFALCMVDIDNFKAINDRFGHVVGDEVLRLISHYVLSKTDDDDIWLRLGGDEFLLIRSNVPSRKVLEDFLTELISGLRREPLLPGGQPLTVSIGASLYPGDGDDVDTLLKAADAAMYDVKFTGKDRFALHSS